MATRTPGTRSCPKIAAIILLAVIVLALVIEMLRLRRRVVQLQKGHEWSTATSHCASTASRARAFGKAPGRRRAAAPRDHPA
jgi:hypothetical protein